VTSLIRYYYNFALSLLTPTIMPFTITCLLPVVYPPTSKHSCIGVHVEFFTFFLSFSPFQRVSNYKVSFKEALSAMCFCKIFYNIFYQFSWTSESPAKGYFLSIFYVGLLSLLKYSGNVGDPLTSFEEVYYVWLLDTLCINQFVVKHHTVLSFLCVGGTFRLLYPE